MPDDSAQKFPILSPNLQVSFYFKLQSIRDAWFHEALRTAMEQLDLRVVDAELAAMVESDFLRKVASFGVRGEVFFAVPCLMQRNPGLLGYYRLLLGFSQKEFYNKGPFGRFKSMEERGEIGQSAMPHLGDLCASLIGSAESLVTALDNLSTDVVKELQLLTLGPQLRGSENTRIGQEATQAVFDLVRSIVQAYLLDETKRTLILENDSGRSVIVEFASDPDIRISEKLESSVRPLVSVEIKGGADASNVHNRIGEAEKSHQKARARGFFEFWTISRVRVADDLWRRESPTTTQFFALDELTDSSSREHARFRETLCSVLGIRK